MLFCHYGINEEHKEFAKILSTAKDTLRISKDHTKIKKLQTDLVEKACKIISLYAIINDKAGIVNSLKELVDYTEVHKNELQIVISQLEYMLTEGIPLESGFLESLYLLIYSVRDELKGE